MIILYGTFDLLLCFLDHGHDHCLEMLGFKDYDFIVVVLPLFMISLLTKEVCLLVGSTHFVMENEVVFCQFGDLMHLLSI